MLVILLIFVLYNREALGLNLTENTCYLECYFDGFAHTFYINAAYNTVM
jgi:hypothetical protein